MELKKKDFGLIVLGAVACAGLFYFFNPRSGRRRRAEIRDRLADTAAKFSDNRLAAQIRAVLEEVSQPGLIDVKVASGFVTLSGPVSPNEANKLIARVAVLDGVNSVENRLFEPQFLDLPAGQEITKH